MVIFGFLVSRKVFVSFIIKLVLKCELKLFVSLESLFMNLFMMFILFKLKVSFLKVILV